MSCFHLTNRNLFNFVHVCRALLRVKFETLRKGNASCFGVRRVVSANVLAKTKAKGDYGIHLRQKSNLGKVSTPCFPSCFKIRNWFGDSLVCFVASQLTGVRSSFLMVYKAQLGQYTPSPVTQDITCLALPRSHAREPTRIPLCQHAWVSELLENILYHL